MRKRYEPRRAMEPVWPWPGWVVYLPWLMVALLTFTMVLQAVRHQPVSWALITPLGMHGALGLWLPLQKRWAEALDDRR